MKEDIENVNLAAFLEGYLAGEADMESSGITDCPYTSRSARRNWWRGYRKAEAKSEIGHHRVEAMRRMLED